MHLKIFLLILFVTIYSVRSFSPKIHHNYHQQQQQQQHNIKHKLPPKNNGTKHLKTEIVGHNKHNPASRHGHALLQKVQDQLNNDGWANEDANQTLVLLSSLLAIECHMIKLDKKRAKDSAEIKHLTEQICAAENKEQIGIHKLINEVANTFEDGKNMVEQMKRDEHTVKVHLDGHYGTLAEILPSAKKHAKATRLRTYHAVLQLLHLITPKLEEGPAKEAMRKMIKKDTVEGSTVMPSELVGLSMSIWSQFIRENHEAIKQIEIGSQHEHRNHPRRQRRRLPVPPNLVQHALAIAMLFFLLCLATLATGGSGQMTVLNIGILLIAAVAVDQIANSARRRVGKSEAQQHLAMNTMPTMGVEDHQMMIERMGKMREDRREGEGIENEQNIMANEAADREEGNIMANVPTNEAADREEGNIMANVPTNEAADREEGNIMKNVPTNEAKDREEGNIMETMHNLKWM
ncbi:hypothetical protein niasHT_039017 [Heterodera trifolii]|uniref:Uncharacterized protein n=1 Tax=Heterodera trifolii TaxID=157864 RepID=A0ABD2J6F2_9BILA